MNNDIVQNWKRDKNCTFCQSLDMNGATPRYREYFPHENYNTQIVDQSDYWVVSADDSPIQDLHLLVISRHHAHSWASSDSPTRADAIVLLDRLALNLKSALPGMGFFLFEHGSGTLDDGRPVHCGACGSHVHAHLHLIAFPQVEIESLYRYIVKKIESIIPQKSIEIPQHEELLNTKSPYLFISILQGSGKMYVTDVDNACFTVPSQLIRSLIGEYLDLQPREWNYKEMSEHNKEVAIQRIQQTKQIFLHIRK